ncbi:MAG TPA: hypothetical protein DCW90_09775 [Lachnospiraceae bacterium]|nr:hypothetical protein [Lachnospiraceae bacterium]
MSNKLKVNLTTEIDLDKLQKNFMNSDVQDNLVFYIGAYETALVNFIVKDGILDLYANDPEEVKQL